MSYAELLCQHPPPQTLASIPSKLKKIVLLAGTQKLWSHLQLLCLSHAAAAKSLQSCPTLCDPMDGSPAGSPISGILQARTLEWVAISFSNAWKWKVKMKVKSLSHVWLSATPWTTAYQAPPYMGFSRQEYRYSKYWSIAVLQYLWSTFSSARFYAKHFESMNLI